jgi:hypothetical protein
VNLTSKIEKLEREFRTGEPEVVEGEYARRWRQAYVALTATMGEGDAARLDAATVCHFEAGRGVWEYSPCFPSFAEARAYYLVSRAAEGVEGIALLMPPALCRAWRDYEKSLGEITASERYAALNSAAACGDCGAEHPYLSRLEWVEGRGNVVVGGPFVPACVLCGGAVAWQG